MLATTTTTDTCVPLGPIPAVSHVAYKSQTGIYVRIHAQSTGECAAFYCSGAYVWIAAMSTTNTNAVSVSLVQLDVSLVTVRTTAPRGIISMP